MKLNNPKNSTLSKENENLSVSSGPKFLNALYSDKKFETELQRIDIKKNPNSHNLEEIESENYQSSKNSLLGEIEESKIFKTQLRTLKYGIPNIFSSGDFLIAGIILKLTISSTEYSALKSATEYHNSILEILVFTFNNGLTETLGIFGSQAFAKNKKERLRLMLHQSIWISLILFLLLSFPVYYLSQDFLRIYGVDVDTSRIFSNLSAYSLPSILLKLVTDNYKTFIFCQGNDKNNSKLGFLSFVNLLVMGVYSFFFIKVFNFGHFGYGLSLFLLEVGNLLICAHFQRYLIDPRTKKLRYTLNYNRGWYICQFIKNSFTEYHFWIVIELSFFTLTLVGSKKQIKAYSILVHFLNAFIAISYGLYVYPRTKLNFLIGKGKRMKAKQALFDFVSAYTVIGIILNIIFYYLFQLLFSHFVEDSMILSWLQKSLFWFCLVSFMYMCLPLVNGGLRSIDKKIYLVISNTFFSIILLPAGVYWLSITNGLEVIGIFIMMILEVGLRIGVHYFTSMVADWNRFKSIY